MNILLFRTVYKLTYGTTLLHGFHNHQKNYHPTPLVIISVLEHERANPFTQLRYLINIFFFSKTNLLILGKRPLAYMYV